MNLFVKRLYEKTEFILHRFKPYYFLISIIAFVLFSGLLFDARLFLMGDDADYLFDGYNFIHHNIYPDNRSSLYGMALGGVMLFSGLNIIVCKLFSFACAVTGFWLLYKAFREKVPDWLLATILLFTAVNSAVLYYSSSNLSEAFFMMVQGMYFHAVFLLIKKQEQLPAFRQQLPYWCYAGVAGLLITLSKNIALLAPLSLIAYYLFKKKYRYAWLTGAFFLGLKMSYELLLRLIYEKNTVVTQFGQVMQKSYYHPERGRESFVGFLGRVAKNANSYLGHDLVNILGLNIPGPALPAWVAGIIAGIVIFICAYAIWLTYRQNRFLFFSGLYLVIMAGTNFIALQPDITQTRIIIVYFPLLFGLLLYGFTSLCRRYLKTTGLFIVVAICCCCIGVNVTRTVVTANKNLPVLRENLSGNAWYGYTPDWINYLSMGQYIKSTLPDSIVIGARKPNSLSAYSGGRVFAWVSSVPDGATADGLLKELAQLKMRYLVLASLRYHAEKATGEIITTLHGYVEVIGKKYPDKVRTVKVIGKEEPCSLVEVLY